MLDTMIKDVFWAVHKQQGIKKINVTFDSSVTHVPVYYCWSINKNMGVKVRIGQKEYAIRKRIQEKIRSI